MKLEEKDGLRILTPDPGMWLYKDVETAAKDGESPYEEGHTERIFSLMVYLAFTDAPENWQECTDAEKEAYEADLSPDAGDDTEGGAE